MKIMEKVPSQLEGRAAGPVVAVSCDCGVPFLWERKRGNKVTCPSCKAEATLTVQGASDALQPADPGPKP
jgi:hypothetical protein